MRNTKPKFPSNEALSEFARRHNRPEPECEGQKNHYWFNHQKEIELIEKELKRDNHEKNTSISTSDHHGKAKH